jgi:hypothetical protein
MVAVRTDVGEVTGVGVDEGVAVEVGNGVAVGIRVKVGMAVRVPATEVDINADFRVGSDNPVLPQAVSKTQKTIQAAIIFFIML